MSSIRVETEGNINELIRRLDGMADVDKTGTLRAIAEGLRTSTIERFQTGESPEGRKWKSSIRARSGGGKTLIRTNQLKASIKAQANSTGAAVGTNLIYAATHQYGASRTIRARSGQYLRFQIGGRWVTVPAVHVDIPARPFLGISKDDEREIADMIEAAFGGQN